jgi:hypothetical protein
MMIRAIAIALLAMVGAQGVATAAEEDASVSPAADEAAAADLARLTLAAHLKAPESELSIDSVEAHTWNDSSLGCGKPGTMALQVITEGYAVTIHANDRAYRVHVSGKNAVICDQPLLTRKEISRPAHARGLDVVIGQASQDLAKRLGVDPAEIRLYGTQPQQWADNTLGCPQAGEVVVAKPVNGFKLFFRYKGRIYTYHSDLSDVRPCPAIETQ